MNLSMVLRILGLMLMIFSLTMLPPIGVAFYYGDGHWHPFVRFFHRGVVGRTVAKVSSAPDRGA